MSGNHDDTHEEETLPIASSWAAPRRVLVVTLDVLGERMAGPAIRAWQLANELSGEHDVVLASTKPLALPPGLVDARCVDRNELKALADWAEVVIVQGFALTRYPFLARDDRILVVDAYAPLYLEQLEQARELGPVAHEQIVRDGVRVMNTQLARADFVICGSERQRNLWLGHLGSLGRINPLTYSADASLRRLIDVVPFGLPANAPRRVGPAIKGVVPGISADDFVVLWGGGVYSWFDPLTVIRTMAMLADLHPRVKLFFMGLVHPNPDVSEMDIAGEARRLSAELGLTGRNIFFNETWVPFGQRADYLLDADVGVSFHFDHVEATFAFRTRILDYLWASLPMVVTAGDSLGEVVGERGAGFVVPPGQPEAIRDSLVALLDPAERERRTVAATAIAADYRWTRTVEPLMSWLRAPTPAADRVGTSMSRSRSKAVLSVLRKDVAVARRIIRSDGLVALVPATKRRFGRA